MCNMGTVKQKIEAICACLWLYYCRTSYSDRRDCYPCRHNDVAYNGISGRARASADGATLDGSAFFFEQGSNLDTYTDPNLNANWVWTNPSTPNLSQSSGPAV